ncbi:hypothetical protein SNE40_022504 [Patella caerulea]|uniref:Activin types I and II receptor domain-containing protein n=1 Tax=Patella caerulea TaxID=87958 RepID=A0AAN8G8C6_PATCE
MTTWLCLAVGWCIVSLSRGALECDCTTEECMSQGLTTCFANKFCYAEYFRDTLTRGCIDKGTPLLCENWRPKNLNTPWPSMFCCNDGDHCNRNVRPTDPLDSVEATTIVSNIDKSDDADNAKKPDCPNAETNSLIRNSGSSKLMNPIYIAVPVAGVCVLLALIIFAMYLLRRRNDFYHHYHYQEHPAHLAQNSCENKKTVTGCGSVNRCTDSERSSSGSETKLFLQV